MKSQKHSFKAETTDIPDRLDKILVQRFEGKSRQYFQQLFDKKFVTVNGRIVKSSVRLKVGDKVEVIFPENEELKLEAKEIPLDIVYEDKNILVINKQPGLVVHPGTHGVHADDSLVNVI